MSEELRPARSKAELTRVRQGWALIVLNLATLLVVLLTHYGVI